jgi:rubrerythrin
MKLLSKAQFRGHLLNIAACSEDSDASFFDSLKDLVKTPEEKRIIDIHRSDEARHASMLRECVLANGVTPYEVPLHLKYFEALRIATDNFLSDLENTEHGVMKAFALLQVAEERSREQYLYLEKAIQPYDQLAASALGEIARDEERHIHYCRVFSRRYAPDPETLEKTINYFRWIESGVFRDFARFSLDV